MCFPELRINIFMTKSFSSEKPLEHLKSQKWHFSGFLQPISQLYPYTLPKREFNVLRIRLIALKKHIPTSFPEFNTCLGDSLLGENT